MRGFCAGVHLYLSPNVTVQNTLAGMLTGVTFMQSIKNYPTILALGLFAVMAATNVDADTIKVSLDGSGDHRTIQAGIDAAADGDEVIVGDGTYTGMGNKDLYFHGKAITVRSENGPENTIIDCEGDGRGINFQSGEGSDSIIQGITIAHGTAYMGGGIYCSDSSPSINNCRIIGNSAGSEGGGIYTRSNSSPTILNCVFSGNTADYGGGMRLGSGPDIRTSST